MSTRYARSSPYFGTVLSDIYESFPLHLGLVRRMPLWYVSIHALLTQDDVSNSNSFIIYRYWWRIRYVISKQRHITPNSNPDPHF